MDMISRQAAIETKAISEWKKEFREYVDSLYITRDDWKGIIEYIDEIPSAQPEHTETHSCDYQRTETHDWIPVTEALPEEKQDVLLAFKHNMVVGFWEDILNDGGQAWYANSGNGWFTGTEAVDDDGFPLAWMPLPEPYKEGQDD